MYAIRTIRSHTTGKVYAPAGAKVTIITVRDHVAICEYNGNRFPTITENLSNDASNIISDQLPQHSATQRTAAAKGRSRSSKARR